MSDPEHPVPGLPVSPGGPKEGNGSTLFCVSDPQGFAIALDVNKWETHIVVRHPELRPHLDGVRRTIEAPELIQVSEGSATAYYYRLTGRTEKRAGDLYIQVVVNRNEETKSGWVKTAHLLRTIKSDERRTVWLKRS